MENPGARAYCGSPQHHQTLIPDSLLAPDIVGQHQKFLKASSRNAVRTDVEEVSAPQEGQRPPLAGPERPLIMGTLAGWGTPALPGGLTMCEDAGHAPEAWPLSTRQEWRVGPEPSTGWVCKCTASPTCSHRGPMQGRRTSPTSRKSLECTCTASGRPREPPQLWSPRNRPSCGLNRVPSLLALHLARGLVQGVPQDGVLLLQAGQLRVGAVLQLLLKSPDLKSQGGASERAGFRSQAGEVPAHRRIHRGQPLLHMRGEGPLKTAQFQGQRQGDPQHTSPLSPPPPCFQPPGSEPSAGATGLLCAHCL